MDTAGKLAEHCLGSSDLVSNDGEAVILARIVSELLSQGNTRATEHIKTDSIGIITPYRAQLKVLASRLSEVSAAAAAVEAFTIDRYQGRDKDVILVSLVRSNESNTIGELLLDWQRLNVALTRARKLMVIVGHLGMLEQVSSMWRNLGQHLRSNGWVVRL